jgi:hypothetical protein
MSSGTVDAMLVVQVDNFDVEALETAGARCFDISGVVLDNLVASCVTAVAEFGGEEDLVSSVRVFEPFPKELFVGVRAIDVAGVPLFIALVLSEQYNQNIKRFYMYMLNPSSGGATLSICQNQKPDRLVPSH